ncbi:tRNA uridine-5-carboxymethylaminomethyl(34) synthesis GTPase MnmE [Taibaiella sp. KBW10]|uniref:tRNA uridine-5-carboxymethylaminomethyl(34) synthesis GTPase MnmE n=1 Tax=Taibaiella sp. KBW10 TaxID=2153357 RepID=UPI000F5A78F5|nr:tRNA uridine-5-carboxymethylaminomethyl(34) synthesis GTPase MnmE [Taibaiella sp. KBW10]RQO31093.1 tRNA uridine-5-carboxymethylaminomethyl(34) synthesis GTPase MnmE [Taibaiella sp. KBW10]
MMHQDTIVALATAPATGAIGVIRLSGSQALSITARLFKGKDLYKQASHTVHFGAIIQPETGVLVDEVVVTLFLGGKSYTGEDTVEISGHGSLYVLHQIIELCVAQGARLAAPGEYTQRAYLNGKLDLAQAEAVADLIAAENKASHQIALTQMRGGISSELQGLREKLINFTALIELELDFAEEDVEFADRTAFKQLIEEIDQHTLQLIQTFEYGNAIKNGVPVAIIGKPNAGKSSLLNALLKEERAIVSNIAGTTRDTIEEVLNIEGINFRFIDTAGLRETEDVVEAIGVHKAKEKIAQAQLILHLYEGNDTELLTELAESLKGKTVFNLRNKVDEPEVAADSQLSIEEGYISLDISAKTGYHLAVLKTQLVQLIKGSHSESSVIITNTRHKEALVKAQEALQEVRHGLEINLSGDLLSFHLKDALLHLGSITGKIDIDRDILGTIFGKFCIGK